MKTLFVIFSLLLAAMATMSAVADFRGLPQVKDLMKRLGYRPGFERALGVIKITGTAGLLIGLGVHGIGVAAAIGFLLYFVLALRAHHSIGDSLKDSGPAIGIGTLSALTALTGVLS